MTKPCAGGEAEDAEHLGDGEAAALLLGAALGPLLLGGSLAITSYVVTASRDVVNVLPGSIRWLLDSFEFLLLIACVSGLYFYVPYTRVRWRHAITAGFLVAGVAVDRLFLHWMEDAEEKTSNWRALVADYIEKRYGRKSAAE